MTEECHSIHDHILSLLADIATFKHYDMLQ